MVPSFKNQYLQSLSGPDAAQLVRRASVVGLRFGADIYQAESPSDWVYFPEEGLVSIIVQTEAGDQAEVGMIGTEGALGLLEACGSRVISARCVVQVPGAAWRVPAEDCAQIHAESAAFRRLLTSTAEFQLFEARQATACRSFHPIQARVARWLLEARERSLSVATTMDLTQEFLAAMLAVQRTTVTAVAQDMQKQGLIRYSRGHIELRNLPGLETIACDCRRVLVGGRARLLAPALAVVAG